MGASRGDVGRSFQCALPQPAKCRRSTAASALVNSPVRCNPPPLTSWSHADHMPITCQSHVNHMSITRQSQANQGPRNLGKYNPWGARTTFQYVLEWRNPDSTAFELLTGIHFPRPYAIFECPSSGGQPPGIISESSRNHLGITSGSPRDHLGIISGSSRDPPPRPQGSRVCDPVSKKVENTPTQICPLGTSEQQICVFLFQAFPHEKTGRQFFLR